MRRYNIQANRVTEKDGWHSSVQLPQFEVYAAGSEEARTKAFTILDADTEGVSYTGALTDGDNVWDLATGRKL